MFYSAHRPCCKIRNDTKRQACRCSGKTRGVTVWAHRSVRPYLCNKHWSQLGLHLRSAHFWRHYFRIKSDSWAQTRYGSDNRATWRSDLWRLQSIRCSAQDCLLIPVWKGWGVHRLNLTFCKKLGGEWKETLPLHSTHAHYGQKGVGSHTRVGCQTHCQTLKISFESECLHEVSTLFMSGHFASHHSYF